MERHGRINSGPHSSSLSPAGSSGRFGRVIKGSTHAPSAKLWNQVSVHHTLRPLLGPPRGQVPAFHFAALPRVHRWSGWSRLYSVWVPGSCPAVLLALVDHLTRLCDSVCPASSQVQGHPPHSSEGSRYPCLVRGIAVLLAKDVMEPVPPADMKAGFFSPYIIVPKKSGGLRPILGLRILNLAFHKLPFKMLKQNCIFGCIHPQDRSAAFHLKDPYFHVSILPRHRPFLRFEFEG